jgi:hypothetical protein
LIFDRVTITMKNRASAAKPIIAKVSSSIEDSTSGTKRSILIMIVRIANIPKAQATKISLLDFEFLVVNRMVDEGILDSGGFYHMRDNGPAVL